jgi:hypothetical protein
MVWETFEHNVYATRASIYCCRRDSAFELLGEIFVNPIIMNTLKRIPATSLRTELFKNHMNKVNWNWMPLDDAHINGIVRQCMIWANQDMEKFINAS